jgi:hypothetical protein
MLRTHDVVLADGTFRIVLTPKRRVIAVLDAPETMLGPIHVALEIDRSPHLPAHISPSVLLDPSHVTAGIFDDIGDGISKAAEGVFNAASKTATTVARPVFDVLKHAAGEGAHFIAHAMPFLPSALRRQMDAASHVLMRARLGDLTAKQFIRSMGAAAKAGVGAAQHIADALIDANKLVAKGIDVPMMIAKQIPGVGDVVRSVSPLEHYQEMLGALQKGDFKAIKQIAERELSLSQGVISLVPGLGTGISAAIGAGIAALEGGNAIEFAIRTAYGAIPIPIGLRQITDTVLEAVLALIEHPHDLSDAVLQVAREKVPSGFPRDVFDTLIHVVAHRHPIQNAARATSLADHFVKHYAPAMPDDHFAAAMHALHVNPALFQHAAQVAANPAHHLSDAIHAWHVNPALFHAAQAAADPVHHLGDAVHANPALFQQATHAPDGGGRMLQPLPLFHG